MWACMCVWEREKVKERDTEWACNAWSSQKRRYETSFLTDTSILSSVRCACAYNVMLGFTWRNISVAETDFFTCVPPLHHLSVSLFLFSINAEKKSVIPIYRSSRCLAKRSVLSFLWHAPCRNEIKKQQKDKSRKYRVKNERIEMSYFEIKAKL